MTPVPEHSTTLNSAGRTSRDWLALLAVLLLAATVRFSTLDRASLWCDEIGQVHSYYFDSYKQVMYWAARFQQPPLDYWIGWGVFKFAHSDFAARLPAAIFGTLTVAVAFLLARRMVGCGVALLVAIGLAASPHMIHYSQEARPYSVFWFTLVLSVWLLARAWEHNRWRDWIVFLPVVACCLLTRSLGSLMMTAGMGLWALADVVRSIRGRQRAAGGTCPDVIGSLRDAVSDATGSNSKSFSRHLLRQRGARLLLCLTVAWAPALHLMQYILHRSRKFGYLAGDAAEAFDWQGNLVTVGQALQAVMTSAMPIGAVLVPLGVVGMVWYLCKRRAGDRERQSVILVPVLFGFAVHVLVYALLVDDWTPKYVYWGYTLPFVYLGAAYLLDRLATWWRQHGRAPLVLNGLWLMLAAGLLMQLSVDHTTAIVHKPDWRAACNTIGRKIDPARDVVFCGEAQLYGTAGMVFRIPPHYWPTADHLVNVLRDQDKLFNDGRPILDRRDCRVALMLRCQPDLDGERLRARLSKSSRLTFAFRDFHQFIVLISRPRFETADEGLLALADAVEQMLGEDHRDLGVHVQMGRAWVLAKTGRTDQAALTLAAARELILSQHLTGFDKVYENLAQQIEGPHGPPARLISEPNHDE